MELFKLTATLIALLVAFVVCVGLLAFCEVVMLLCAWCIWNPVPAESVCWTIFAVFFVLNIVGLELASRHKKKVASSRS